MVEIVVNGVGDGQERNCGKWEVEGDWGGCFAEEGGRGLGVSELGFRVWMGLYFMVAEPRHKKRIGERQRQKGREGEGERVCVCERESESERRRNKINFTATHKIKNPTKYSKDKHSKQNEQIVQTPRRMRKVKKSSKLRN